MRKSEIYNIIVDKVCEVCEVNREHVVNHRKFHAVVEARVMAVQYLRRIGLTSDDIALLSEREITGDSNYCPPLKELKKKAKTMDKLFNSYSAMCIASFTFCLMSKEVAQFCRDSYKEHYLSWMKPLP